MFRATNIPALSWLLDGLRTRNPATIAKHLGISVATLERYRKADHAPRPILLALWYESSYGYQELFTEAHNSACMANRLASSLETEVSHLRQRVDLLQSLGTHGAANDPIQRPHWQPPPSAELYEGPHGRRVEVGQDMAARRSGMRA